MFRKRLFTVKAQLASFRLSHPRSFLSNAYRCSDAWNARTAAPILQKVNHDDFYNAIDQNYGSKGVMSAIDVDIFANSMTDGSYLDELRDLLHKLRLTADTGNMLPSTHYAAIRGYLEQGRVQDLLNILWDPLNYGVFLDEYTANIVIDHLLNESDYKRAAIVASLVMLQEEYTNEITRALSLYSSYKFVSTYEPEPVVEPEAAVETKGKKEKIEEIKIRIKYLRNPYFDDHFDLTDHVLRAGKTLAWIAESKSDNLHYNLQILGWLYYKKYDKLIDLVNTLSKNTSFRVYNEVLECFKKQREDAGESCTNILSQIQVIESGLENDLKILIENSINTAQQEDIKQQVQMFNTWGNVREEKLQEQTQRLDKARRIQILEEKQKQMVEQEQKLWFFENEEKIDLEIENKFVFQPKRWFGKKKTARVVDANYIPPEIIPKKLK